jgi:enoyl-CoA hydratase
MQASGGQRFMSELIESGSDKLIGRCDPPFGWMTFNNPERRNAVSLDMWAAIPRVLERFDGDPDIRVVIIAGAGGKAFVSGADISQFETERSSVELAERYASISALAHKALADLRTPSIAMIEGYCLGGGMAVALACDLRIASADARFGIPAARLGLGYNFDGIQRLVSLVGPAATREIMFTARQFAAIDAMQMGLINRVAEPGQLNELVLEYAGQIAANAPLTVHAAKLAVKEAARDAEQRDTAAIEASVAACFGSADYAEGRRAFMEKRVPQFHGR